MHIQLVGAKAVGQLRGGVNNMRRVAPFCACFNRSPTSLASFSAIAILAQAIGNKPLAASLCIPQARVQLRPTAVRLAPVDHRTTTRASWRAERSSTCTLALSSTGTPRTHPQIKSTFCSFVLARCEVSVGRGVEVTQVGGRTALTTSTAVSTLHTDFDSQVISRTAQESLRTKGYPYKNNGASRGN